MSVKCKACSKTVYVMDQQLSLPDGAAFHKACFRCRQCNASLQLSNFSSLDGALYCKPHFNLLSKDKHPSTNANTATNPTDLTTVTAPTPTSPTTVAAPANATTPTSPKTVTTTNATTPTSPTTTDATTTTNTTAPTTTAPAPSAPTTKPVEKVTPTYTRSPSKAAIMFSGTQDKCVTCAKTVYPLEKVTVEEQAYHKSCFRCSHGGCAITPSNYAALQGVVYCKHHFKQLFKEKGSYNHIMKTASMKRTAAQPQPIASAAPDA